MANQQELEILLKAKNLTEEAFRAVQRATDDLEKKVKGNKSGFDGMRSSVNSFFKDNEESFSALGKGLGLVGAGIGAVGGAVVALGVRGSTVVGVKNSFDTLAQSVGDTGAAILSVTRTATKGLISDMDIMAAVNKGILLGLPLTSKEMGTLASTAIVLGKAMQRGPTDALNDLIVGLGRGSPLILDNLGITLDSALAYEKYGASIGKASKDLTDAEKKIALYREATSAAALKVAELGGINLTFADRVTQGKVALGNLVDGMSMAVATSPAINRALEVISGSVIGAFGGNSQKAVDQLGGYVNAFAGFLVTAAKVAVTGAGWIVQAWDGTKVLFQGVMVAVTGLAEGVTVAMLAVVTAATKVPGIGDKFKGVASNLEDMRVITNAMRKDFQAQIGETLDGAGKHKAAFDSMTKGLSFLENEMQKAAASGKSFKAGGEEQAGVAKKVETSAVATSAALKQWKEKAAELDSVLRTAIKNQAPLTVVTEQYGSAIAEVVRGAQVMGTAVPAAVAKMAKAIEAAQIKEALNEIRLYTSKVSADMLEEAQKAARGTADAITESLIASVTAERQYQQKRTEATAFGVGGRLQMIELERREAILKLGEPPAGMEAQWRRSTDAINGYFREMSKQAADQSGAVANTFAGIARTVAGEIGGIFGSVLEGAAMLVEGLVAASADKFGGLAGFMNSRIGKTAVAAMQIGMEGFGAGYGAGRGMGRGKGALVGAATGAMGGLATGAMIGAAGGPIGMLGGALIGGAAGILGGLLGGGKKAAEERETVKALRAELVKTFGTMEDLRKAASDVGVRIDAAFSSNKPAEVEAVINRLNEALAAKQSRLEGIGIVYDALARRSAVFAEQAFGQIEKLEEAHEKELDAAKAAGKTEAEIAELRKKHATEAAAAVSKGAIEQIDAYQRIGMFATAAIASQIKETGNLLAAFDAAESSLSVLAHAEKTFGFEAEGAFAKVMQMREGIAVNRDVFEGLQANTDMMRGFGQAGIMSRDLFNAFGADVGEQLRTLQGRQADSNVTMAAAQPILQMLWEAQKKYGNVTDETTAAMLKQAEEQGLVGPQMQSVNQQILDVLVGIRDVLAGGITGAFAGAATASGHAANTMIGNLERARIAAEETAGAIAGVGAGGGASGGASSGGGADYGGYVDYNGDGRNENGYSTGTKGVHGRWWENFGAGRDTVQHGQTAIIHPDQTAGFVADHLDYNKLASLIGKSGGGAPTVIVQIGPREIRDFIVKTVNDGSADGSVTPTRRSVKER